MNIQGVLWRGIGFAAVGVFGLSAGPVSAAMSASETKAMVEQQTNGKVLKIETMSVDGRTAYAVRVMNAGGNANDAFQVYTVVIDAASGTVMPETVSLQPDRPRTASD